MVIWLDISCGAFFLITTGILYARLLSQAVDAEGDSWMVLGFCYIRLRLRMRADTPGQ
jgi:hypothetical protein